jgi:hypothetical protein
VRLFARANGIASVLIAAYVVLTVSF